MVSVMPMGVATIVQQNEGILKKFGRWYSTRDRVMTRINPPKDTENKAKRFSKRMNYKGKATAGFRKFKE